jgi:hypothetical protein
MLRSHLFVSSWTGEATLCPNAEGRKKVGLRYSSSREAATQESPARQCLGAKVEQSRVREGRHRSCVTVSRRPSLHRIRRSWF